MDSYRSSGPLVLTWVLGGESDRNKPWVQAVTSLDRRAKQFGDAVASPLRVNVAYFIPGPIYQASFSGVRTGKYERDHNMLLIQAAIADLDGPSPEASLLVLLESALDAAERWSVRRHLEVDHLRVLRDLSSRIAGPIA